MKETILSMDNSCKKPHRTKKNPNPSKSFFYVLVLVSSLFYTTSRADDSPKTIEVYSGMCYYPGLIPNKWSEQNGKRGFPRTLVRWSYRDVEKMGEIYDQHIMWNNWDHVLEYNTGSPVEPYFKLGFFSDDIFHERSYENSKCVLQEKLGGIDLLKKNKFSISTEETNSDEYASDYNYSISYNGQKYKPANYAGYRKKKIVFSYSDMGLPLQDNIHVDNNNRQDKVVPGVYKIRISRKTFKFPNRVVWEEIYNKEFKNDFKQSPRYVNYFKFSILESPPILKESAFNSFDILPSVYWDYDLKFELSVQRELWGAEYSEYKSFILKKD